MSAAMMLEPQLVYEWVRRVEAEWRAGAFTSTQKDALLALRHFAGPDGLFPSEASIAAKGVCSQRTVRRTKAIARNLGLLSWEHRRQLVGGRWRRSSNSYRLSIPPGAPQHRRRSSGQRVRGESQDIRKKVAQQRSMALIASLIATVDPVAAAKQVADRQILLQRRWLDARQAKHEAMWRPRSG